MSTALFRLVLLLLALVVVALILPAHAWAVTTPQPDDVVLVAPSQTPTTADTVGAWSQTPGTLAVTTLSPDHRHLWLARAPLLGDGHVRAVIDAPTAGKWSLLLRVTADAQSPLAFSGIGLELTKTGATWVRWDHGQPHTLDKPVDIAWRGAPRLEVEIFAVGPHVAAQILDADSLRVLGALSLTDATYLHGRLGVHLDARHPNPVRIWRLVVRPALQPTHATPAPTSPWRFVRARPEELGNWQAATGHTLVAVATDRAGRTILRTDVGGLERLRRLDVNPDVVVGDAPFAWLAERTGGRYLDPTTLHAQLADLVAQHPQRASLHVIGQTSQGRPIEAVHWATPHAPKVLIVGGIHGDELMAVLHAWDMLRELATRADPQHARWRDQLDVWVVPMLNPDGVVACMETSVFAGRKSGRTTEAGGEPGVDLNRNFPHRWGALGDVGSRSWPGDPWYRGPTPGSEPETQALMQLALAQKFTAAISYHTVGTLILPSYTIPDAPNPDPDPVWALGEAMAAAAPKQPSGRRFVVKRRMYPVDGVLEDWLRATTGTAAILVEGPVQNPRDVRVIDQAIAAVRPTWQAMLDAVSTDPRAYGFK